MSSDTMPCGCEGHADNAGLCRYPALLARAEKAELERDEWHQRANDEGAAVVRRDEEIERLEDALDEESSQRETYRIQLERAEAELEKARADNAALLDAIRAHHEAWKNGRDILTLAALLRLAGSEHPGAALLEERERIRKALDQMDVPSEADEAEKGRALDVAGRVELLATWGRRGWTEYRRLKDADAKRLERLRALETLREAARAAHSAMKTLSDEDVPTGFDDAQGDLGVALQAADALKEAP